MNAASPTGSAPGAAHPALFAALASFWLGKGIALALAALVLERAWRDALALLASIAGIHGVLVVLRASRALQAPGAGPASSDRKTLVAAAALAATAVAVGARVAA